MTFTLRGTVRQGRIVLVDEVDLEDGSILEIRVVKSGTQIRMENEAASRARTQSSPLRFGWTKSKMSSDPIEIAARLPKSNVPKLKFDGYVTPLPLGGFTEDLLKDLATFAIGLSDPPEEIVRKVQTAFRRRNRGALVADSKEAREFNRTIRDELESQALEDENRLALWHVAAAASTRGTAYVVTALNEIPIHAAEIEVDVQHRQHKGARFSATVVREEQVAHYQAELRRRLFDLLIARVRALRRSYSGSNAELKLARKELGEIASQLTQAQTEVSG